LYSPKYLVIAAVNDVLPWSTWPIVPMFTCGLLRSNLPFAIFGSPFSFSPLRAIYCFCLRAGPASCDANPAVRQI